MQFQGQDLQGIIVQRLRWALLIQCACGPSSYLPSTNAHPSGRGQSRPRHRIIARPRYLSLLGFRLTGRLKSRKALFRHDKLTHPYHSARHLWELWHLDNLAHLAHLAHFDALELETLDAGHDISAEPDRCLLFAGRRGEEGGHTRGGDEGCGGQGHPERFALAFALRVLGLGRTDMSV